MSVLARRRHGDTCGLSCAQYPFITACKCNSVSTSFSTCISGSHYLQPLRNTGRELSLEILILAQPVLTEARRVCRLPC